MHRQLLTKCSRTRRQYAVSAIGLLGVLPLIMALILRFHRKDECRRMVPWNDVIYVLGTMWAEKLYCG